jgi:enamine deaminase RidA (YjgF/YER057c/UK114 family)
MPGVTALDRAAFHDATVHAYRRLEAELRGNHPVRLWNHIPGIHDTLDDGLDRYRVFNAGRFEALSQWYGGKESFDTRVASASGVGHDGEDLVVHCLAADHPGRPVVNPRQIAPYRYSCKFGPKPPCFARATVIHPDDSAPLVLVGGTASIVGEESVHLGDLARQMEETLTNLGVLLGEAAGKPASLETFRELRVYYPDSRQRHELRRLLEKAVGHRVPVEWVRADLCRSELLVEIEGVAELAG